MYKVLYMGYLQQEVPGTVYWYEYTRYLAQQNRAHA